MPTCDEFYAGVRSDFMRALDREDIAVKMLVDAGLIESRDAWFKKHGLPAARPESAPATVDVAKTPLCPVHASIDKKGKLEMTIGGLGCVACSLQERVELLDLLAPFAPKDHSEDSINSAAQTGRVL